jgi:hypothetical protein
MREKKPHNEAIKEGKELSLKSTRPYVCLEFVEFVTHKILYQREAIETTRSPTASYLDTSMNSSRAPWSRTSSFVTSPRPTLHQSFSHKLLPSFLYYYQLSSQNHAIEAAAVKPLDVAEEMANIGWEEEEEWGDSIFRDEERMKLLQPFANEEPATEINPVIQPINNTTKHLRVTQNELQNVHQQITRLLRQVQREKARGSMTESDVALDQQVDHLLHEMAKLEAKMVT